MQTRIEARPLYLAAQVREMDRRVIAEGGEGFWLMRQAGEAAYALLRARWPRARRLCVLCGGGNNGGDGYVLAALAAADGLTVQLIALTPPDKLAGDARRAYELAAEAGLDALGWRDELTLDGEVMIDAMLGTGARGAPRGDVATAIAQLDAAGRPVMALDVPSGVDVDSGHVEGAAVRATLTLTFIADKFGLHTGAALDHVGDLTLADLGVDAPAFTDLAPVAWCQDAQCLATALPPRRPSDHKGTHGHVLVIAGAPGMGGAALMTSEMVARVGAGKVSLATDAAHVAASLTRFPEVMAHGVRGGADLAALVAAADVIAVGPGIGTGAWGQAALQQALAVDKPCVVDADGLNLLAARESPTRRDAWVLTPHPGEAARLLGWSTAAVQRDRRGAVIALQQRWGGCVVLKGPGTLVYDGERLDLCPYGNPGMASGGMGDALTGIVAGLLGQLGEPARAARLGVLIHALAADAASAAGGQRGLLASDLASYARRLANP
ncbi:NAD(P)H-hydrate dehydratase [Salinicola sp. DM10]|uniref:NAD(P)H-hydrate dehydratase n=1 Tax=Salinicola sp. DM10 TaxID=2815721 RepID=UPI001A9036FD|nr:NAD(P)H-hydrate dehydratase [Salinicola sp. DM10]MCE3026296.1 NAD(P)H-hydrate dehydratase [Salinicola sp. DM10]